VRLDEINFPGLRLLHGCYVGNMAGRYQQQRTVGMATAILCEDKEDERVERCERSVFESQFSEGRSMWSMTRVLTGPLVESSFEAKLFPARR